MFIQPKRNGVMYIPITTIWSVFANGEELFVNNQEEPINILLDIELDPHETKVLLGLFKLVKRPIKFYSFEYLRLLESFAEIGELILIKGYKNEERSFTFKGSPAQVDYHLETVKSFESKKRNIHKQVDGDYLILGSPYPTMERASALYCDLIFRRSNIDNLLDLNTNTIVGADGPGGSLAKALEIHEYLKEREFKDTLLINSASSSNAIVFVSDIWANRIVLPESFLLFHEPTVTASGTTDRHSITNTDGFTKAKQFKDVSFVADRIITGTELIEKFGCKPLDYDYMNSLMSNHVMQVRLNNETKGA